MINIISNIKIKNIAWAFALAIFFFIDRYLKYLAINYWPSTPKKLLGNLLTFNFTPNYNIAFSLPLSGVWLNALISIIILVIFAYIILNKKNLSKLEIISLSAIIIGALSNLLDRFNYGYVIDYLDLKWFTIFNLGDILISVSTLVLLIYFLKPVKNI